MEITMSPSNRVRIAYRQPGDAIAKADPDLAKKLAFMSKMDPPNDQWRAAEEFLKQQGFDSEPLIDWYLEQSYWLFRHHPTASPRSAITFESLGDSGQQVVRFRIFMGLPFLQARLQRQFMKPFTKDGRLYATICIYAEPL